MKRSGLTKIFLFVALALLVLSIVLAIVSLFPIVTGGTETHVLLDNTFYLTSGEIRRQGLGSFHGGENISVIVQGSADYPKNFSIISYNETHFAAISTTDITFSFTAGADYYEAVFISASQKASNIHFEATVQKLAVVFPYSWLNLPAKILFFISISSALLITVKIGFKNSSNFTIKSINWPTLGKKGRQRLIVLLLLSLILWFSLLLVNTNSLSTFEEWYTDLARHSYTSTLFTKVGFSIFGTSLDKLASSDNSYYKFVTWPEMPHLYPLGSILFFLPFGYLLQNDFDPTFVYKTEIALFLVFAHLCLYFFLKYYWKKEIQLSLKLVGVYIIYLSLVIYSANGMFDAIPFLFSLIGLTLFLTGRYDYFILFSGVSVFFKYQAAIYLFPLIIFGIIKLFQEKKLSTLVRNKAVVAGAILALISGFTAYLSAPFLFTTRQELIMNGINAFSSNSQISWWLQSFAVLLTLGVTIVYSVYMLNKNSLMSLSALFLLLPSYLLPYFQNWYLPFIFVYVLIPQHKKELDATILWLIFLTIVLSFGGIAFNPLQILNNLRVLLKL